MGQKRECSFGLENIVLGTGYNASWFWCYSREVSIVNGFVVFRLSEGAEVEVGGGASLVVDNGCWSDMLLAVVLRL